MSVPLLQAEGGISGRQALASASRCAPEVVERRYAVGALLSCSTSTVPHSLELLFQRFELIIVERFEMNELWPRARGASDELIELQMHRSRVTVLRVLQQERDEKRHLRRRRVHRQLPRIRELKHRTEQEPEDR
jgi:hypothetical protein